MHCNGIPQTKHIAVLVRLAVLSNGSHISFPCSLNSNSPEVATRLSWIRCSVAKFLLAVCKGECSLLALNVLEIAGRSQTLLV